MVSRRKHLQHGTLVDAHPQVKKLWFERDLEPELLSGEPMPDLPDERDPLRERDAKVLLSRLLEKCTKREAKVLALRHFHEMTLEEVAITLGVTRERVRQIESKGMFRMRFKTVSDKDVRSFFR